MAVILKRAKGLNTASNSLTNWTQGMFGYPRNVAPTHPCKLSASEHRSKLLSSLENGKEPWNSMWVLVAFFSTVAKKVFMWPGNLRRGVRLGGYPCCRNWWKSTSHTLLWHMAAEWTCVTPEPKPFCTRVGNLWPHMHILRTRWTRDATVHLGINTRNVMVV